MLRTRLIFGFLMIAAVVGVLVIDAPTMPYYPLFWFVVSMIVWTASGEFAVLLGQLPVPVKARFVQTGCVIIVWSNWLPHLFMPSEPAELVFPEITAPLCAFVVMSMAAFLLAAWEFVSPGGSVMSIATHVLAFFYVGVLGSFVVQMRWLGTTPETGAFAFFLCVFVAKFCDIGAYFTGRFFGRRPIAPVLSPGKTIEGCTGGLAAAVALAFAAVAMGEWLTGVRVFETAGTLGFGLALGVTAQVGDLMESLIKRDCQRKDASASIPGFGGMLDVVDSVLFCGPVAYLLVVGMGDVAQH